MAARLLIPMKCQHIRKKSPGFVGKDKGYHPRQLIYRHFVPKDLVRMAKPEGLIYELPGL